jgi:diacylglycerol kinase family enzyme
MGGILRFDKMDIALDDGLFEVMLIKNPKKPGDLQKIINCLTRQKFDCDLIVSFKTNRIELNMADRAPWSLDGEYQEGLEDICVENLHSAIRILR